MKIDWIFIGALVVFTIVSCYLIIHLYSAAIQECTRNPLVFAAEKYENEYKNSVVSGRLVLQGETVTGNPTLDIFKFNSSSIEKVDSGF